MSRRAFAFLIFAIVVSAGCIRLGFWQLDRLSQRRATNAMLVDRLSSPPRPVRDVVRDSKNAAFRRATASGTYDFANEFALAARTREGSPGVNLLTPMRVAGTDAASDGILTRTSRRLSHAGHPPSHNARLVRRLADRETDF